MPLNNQWIWVKNKLVAVMQQARVALGGKHCAK
jgi:hypothetical protein